MATFKYLWQNRKKNKFLSKSFFKSCAKRIFTLRELIFRNIRRIKLVLKGAKIGQTTEFSNLQISGKYNLLLVGNFTFIGKVCMALHDNVIIGNNVVINDGTKIFTASHDVSCSSWTQITAPVIIEDYVWIASDAIILPGVIIQRGAVVGAGAVVSKSVPPYSIVVGNPAKVLQNKNRPHNLIYNPCDLLACNAAWLI